jgi:hypothetical protein
MEIWIVCILRVYPEQVRTFFTFEYEKNKKILGWLD